MTQIINGGCDDESGEITPKGRHISQHVIENINNNKKGHNVSWDYVDFVIDNHSKPPALQTDGRVVYVYRQPARVRLYSVVIMENGNCVVTALRNIEKTALYRMADKNGWRGLEF